VAFDVDDDDDAGDTDSPSGTQDESNNNSVDEQGAVTRSWEVESSFDGV
jgi:hypothetical protein